MPSYPQAAGVNLLLCVVVCFWVVFLAGYSTMVGVGVHKDNHTTKGALVGTGTAGLIATVAFGATLIIGLCGCCCQGDSSRRVVVFTFISSFLAVAGSSTCFIFGVVHGLHDAYGVAMVAGGAVLFGHAVLVLVICSWILFKHALCA